MAAHTPGPRAVRAIRILVPSVALPLAVATALVVGENAGRASTHSGASDLARVADLVAGLGLICAGLLACWVVPQGLLGALATLAGIAWLGPDWVGWTAGPPVARSIAMVVVPFFLPISLQLVLAAPRWKLSSLPARTSVRAAYACAAVVAVGNALFRDPFLDPNCWSNCTDNVLLVQAMPGLVRILDVAWVLASASIGLLLAAPSARRMSGASRTALQANGPILVPGFLLGIATFAHSVALLREPLERPFEPGFAFLFHARAWPTAGLAVGLAWALVRVWRARFAIGRVTEALGESPPPGLLATALAQATGDTRMEVLYPLPGSGRYANASGSTVERPGNEGRRALTPIVRGGREVALVVHDPEMVDAEQLRREIGPAARLAIDNERLHAEVLNRLHDLRAARTRIVAAGDEERRRLERNLHDGVQQSLVALTYDLRLALSAGNDLGPEVASLLTSAAEDAHEALQELRDLAHGIYPAILTEAGLGPALWTLADSAPIPVEVDEIPDERFAGVVERTAFLVASEAVDEARRKGADTVQVRAFRDDRRLVVEVTGAGKDRFVHMADRVGALGGTLSSGGDGLKAVIPCA